MTSLHLEMVWSMDVYLKIYAELLTMLFSRKKLFLVQSSTEWHDFYEH